MQVDIKGFLQDRTKILSESVQLVYSSAVVGDIAEFGISLGNSFQVIAATMGLLTQTKHAQLLPTKHLHGFDSFKGLPVATLPGDIDSPMVEMGIWAEGKCGSIGEAAIFELAQRHITPDRIHLYPGWFSDTLPNVPAGTKFALVHIDCDFYESSIQVLDDLFANKRLSDGAILVFDDFLENRSSKKLSQRRAWEECKTKYSPDFTDLGFHGKGCWRCIVHID